MFTQKTPKYQLQLEDELEQMLKSLKSELSGSEDYAKKLGYVERLHEMTAQKRLPVSKDTMLVVGANIVGILMIIHHEHLNPITTRALSFVMKADSRAL